MVLIVPEQSQRPYRFGMTLLCVGALFNWLGLADNYSEPVPAIRYIGVGLIAAGASLICMAMCFWMRTIHDPTTITTTNDATDVNVTTDPIHVISVDVTMEKPPDYAAVVDIPPCYEDAVKLNPSSLFMFDNLALKSDTIVLSRESTLSSQHTYPLSDEQPKTDTRNADVNDGSSHLDSNQLSQRQNSSHNDNYSFTEVLRKSIREIRKQLRGSESNSATNHQTLPNSSSQSSSTSNADNGTIQESDTDVCKNLNK